MWESHVYINGKKVGGYHFGYLSFEIDITDAIVPGDNLIAIHAIVHPASSRWYSGAGIYRNLRLVTKPTTHICYNGVWVKQIYADSKSVFSLSISSHIGIGRAKRERSFPFIFTRITKKSNSLLTAYRMAKNATQRAVTK